MPRYDFRCASCDRTFEATIPLGSMELPPCPQCGKRTVEKMITPPLGIHFHGSGFYKTDSRLRKEADGTKGTEGTKGVRDSTENPKGTDVAKGTEKKSPIESVKEDKKGI